VFTCFTGTGVVNGVILRHAGALFAVCEQSPEEREAFMVKRNEEGIRSLIVFLILTQVSLQVETGEDLFLRELVFREPFLLELFLK